MLSHCAVSNCTGGESDSQPLFRFPLDSERCKQWLEKCQREDLIDKPAEQLYKYERLCGKHFQQSAIDSAKPNEKDIKGRKKMKKPEPEPEPESADSTQPLSEEDENREYLKSLFEIVLLLGGHNISPTYQGEDSENNPTLSNFQALLDYRIQSGDDILRKKWDENKEKFPDELNKMIEVCEQYIRGKLVEEVTQSGNFSLITDNLVTISGELLLPVFVRFVDKTNSQRESFLGLVCFNGEEDVVAENVLNEISEKWGLKMEQCKGQAHSCSGTHSSKIKKFAAKVTERFPAAVLAIRSTQTLNISLANSLPLVGVQLVMSTLKKIGAFFSRSALLGAEFEQAISLFYEDRAEKANALKGYCQTKWTDSHNVFEIGVEIYESLLLWLDSVNDNEDVRWSDQVAHEAMVISKALTDFEFLMTLIVLKNITALTQAIGKNMHGNAADISGAASSLPAVLQSIKEVADNIDVYHEFWYEEATNIASVVDVTVKVPRSFLRKQSESVAIHQENYYKEYVSFAVVSGIYNELSEVVSEHVLKTLKGLALVPAAIEQNKSAKPDEDCVEFFKSDVPNADSFSAELNCWWVKWSKKTKQESFPTNVQDTLQLADMKFFPNMLAVFRLLAILPCLSFDNTSNVVYQRFSRYMEEVPDRMKSKSVAFMNINSHVQCDLDSLVDLFVKTDPK
ncbi:THAP domain containing 12a isoform X2 [Boleophthalmus pectinirostris]|uniref:THAP domain containing 12a isoform X2 n=1 Tax=Boleophthalmus pectinirostris TaxID=150288 RepID=UPI00242A3F8B|nr:THAP domain containing 12a isoform X2 [Boleophthalmus pectinirostris]